MRERREEMTWRRTGACFAPLEEQRLSLLTLPLLNNRHNHTCSAGRSTFVKGMPIGKAALLQLVRR